VTDTEE